MICPLFGRRRWSHAYEHGDLSEDRGGAGDEVTGSVVTSHIGQDQVVAGSGVDRHQRAADATIDRGGESCRRTAAERAMKLQEVLLRATSGKIKWWRAGELIGISERQMRR